MGMIQEIRTIQPEVTARHGGRSDASLCGEDGNRLISRSAGTAVYLRTRAMVSVRYQVWINGILIDGE